VIGISLTQLDDTIAAIAAASGGAARGILRVSGPQALDIVSRIWLGDPLPADAGATVVTGEVQFDLDGHQRPISATAFVWPNSRSYTRQPTIELHTLGSPPVLDAILNSLCQQGARVAQPGEFTLRAFLAGRLDLTQAEAVLGVIDARGEQEFRSALAQLAGGLAKPLHALRTDLLDVLADLEAGLDFVEEDIEFISADTLLARLSQAVQIAQAALAQLELRREGIAVPTVVLLGPPNAGKSSLFNALAGQEHAIVSSVPGTTRDYLSARLHLDGIEVELIDTAGMEHQPDSSRPESVAQQLTAQQEIHATIILRCSDSHTSVASSVEHNPPNNTITLNIVTKVDDPSAIGNRDDAILTSSYTGRGLNELRSHIRTAIINSQAGQGVIGTAARCRDSLLAAIADLNQAAELAAIPGHEELIAAEIRRSLGELGKVVGAVYTDDVLDRIFSRFCIGK